jgi:hypothetical protein
LRAGVYLEAIDDTIQAIPSGTDATHVTTIASFAGETATLRPTGALAVISVANSSSHHITFDRLVLDAINGAKIGTASDPTTAAGAALALGMNGAHHVTFQRGELLNGWSTNVVLSGTNNTVATSSCHGSVLFACVNVTGSDNSLDGNDLYANAGSGVQVYHDTPADAHRHSVRNNLLHGNGFTRQVAALLVGHGNDNLVFNNVLYENFGGMDVGAQGTNNQLYHNTIYNNGWGIQLLTGALSPQLSNNIVYGNTAGDILPNGVAYIGTQNLTTDPSFANPGAHDFSLSLGSVAMDAGGTLAAVPTDKDGRTRPQGNFVDLGAYEYPQAAGPVPNVFYSDVVNGQDSRDCTTAQTQGTPLRSLTKGVTCLTVPGAILYLRAGTYPEAIDTSVQHIAGGIDWTHPTTIAAYPGEVVTLTLPSGSTISLFFRSAPDDYYILLDRLILDGGGPTSLTGFVAVSGVHHLRFQRGEIKNFGATFAYIQNAANIDILNSSLHEVAHGRGIKLVGTVSNTRIEGNTFRNVSGECIDADGTDDPTEAFTNTTILNNVFAGCGGADALPAITVGGTNNTGNQLVNNQLTDSYAGIRVRAGAQSALVANNTLYAMTTSGIEVGTGAQQTVVVNNIVTASASGILDSGTGTIKTPNLVGSPPFVDPATGNFQLAPNAVLAIDTGIDVPQATPDRMNVSRPKGLRYDLGALEFTGTPSGPAGQGSSVFLLGP